MTEKQMDGVLEVGGRRYMRDAAARLVPEELVRPEQKLEDQMVRGVIVFAEDLSRQIERFRGHTFDDLATFLELLGERYGQRRGGSKGNCTFSSYDGLCKVTLQVQDQLTFGPELNIAKGLVDECILAWSEDARPEIRALVEHAFQTDKEGRINRSSLFALKRLEIEDKQWQRAMAALSDAIRVIGSKEYLRFYRRDHHKARWEAISIDLANSGE